MSTVRRAPTGVCFIMSIVGNVESLWRYPVKSMRGQELDTAYIAFSGVYGDRLYAPEFCRAGRVPLPDGPGAGADAALSASVSLCRSSRQARQLGCGRKYIAGINPLYAERPTLL